MLTHLREPLVVLQNHRIIKVDKDLQDHLVQQLFIGDILVIQLIAGIFCFLCPFSISYHELETSISYLLSDMLQHFLRQEALS